MLLSFPSYVLVADADAVDADNAVVHKTERITKTDNTMLVRRDDDIMMWMIENNDAVMIQ